MAKLHEATVDTPSKAYCRMEEAWDPIDDLMGGTRAMRRAGQRWLPKEKGESPAAYRARLTRSILYGAFRDTVGSAVSKPFAKPVSVIGTAPDYLAGIEKDANRESLNLTGFLRAVMADAVSHGISYILVDYPKVGEGMNFGVEKALNIRPYFVHVKARDLIFAKVEERADGSDAVTEIRMRECYAEADGYASIERKRVRVIKAPTFASDGTVAAPGTWEIHEQDAKGGWTTKEKGTHTFPGIPIVPVYTARTDLFEADAPLEDLAWLNIAHWQSMSDQRNIVHTARVPILFGAGWDDEDKEQPFEIGSSRVIMTSDPQATLAYVEHGGAAIDSGAKDLADLEERMQILGLQPFMLRPGSQTATGQMIDEGRAQSDLKSWTIGLQDAALEAYRMAALWVNQTLPSEFAVNIHGDFELGMKASQDIEQLIKMRTAREISRETFLTEIKRRALIAESVDVEEEIQRIEDEGPALGTIGMGPNIPPLKVKNGA